MKTFFNQKAWLYSLGLTILSVNSAPIFAQDSNSSTDHKVTSIQKSADKDVQIFINNSSTLSNKDYSSSDWFQNRSNTKDSDKPLLGVLLKGNVSDIIILKTFPNTAAATIGLQENDKIISINGHKVTSIARLNEIIQSHKIGDAIAVQYERDGLPLTASSTLLPTKKDHYLSARKNYTTKYNYDYNYSNRPQYSKENACEELEKIYGKPFLGVYLSNPHQEYGDGAKLTSIIEGTGAEEAVLMAADKITKMDKTAITSSKEAMKFIKSKQPGDQIKIQVVRGNKTMLIKATLGSWADSPNSTSKIKQLEAYCDANKLAEKEMEENACERLEEIYGKPFLGVYFNNPYAEGGDGAMLNSIITGTGAEAANLEPADRITKMNQTPINSSQEAIKFIKSKQPGDQIKMQVIRENKTILINATLGSWANNPQTFSQISKLEAYCDAKSVDEEEEEEVAPKENTADVLMPSFETQAIMEVFPNPTADFVTIKFEGKKAPLTINVMSLNGQMMLTKNIQNFDGNYNNQLDLSKYPSGVYLIHLTQADQQMTQQVVVE